MKVKLIKNTSERARGKSKTDLAMEILKRNRSTFIQIYVCLWMSLPNLTDWLNFIIPPRQKY